VYTYWSGVRLCTFLGAFGGFFPLVVVTYTHASRIAPDRFSFDFVFFFKSSDTVFYYYAPISITIHCPCTRCNKRYSYFIWCKIFYQYLLVMRRQHLHAADCTWTDGIIYRARAATRRRIYERVRSIGQYISGTQLRIRFTSHGRHDCISCIWMCSNVSGISREFFELFFFFLNTAPSVRAASIYVSHCGYLYATKIVFGSRYEWLKFR